ncbi:putative selenium metabolism protein, YedE family [Anaerohalosphaera lusitana]|uniref:Putative selenium metabolism protein, YedE family n=1 Tax=Anaerohalosphaera lusitana TaxID=1936003 RepID=A0A1U9NQA3_9BACT|nr:DUF6691 family protein [Anaerohalosphaera lusitana]AQT69914.1 putative selenium metabolism protein, YedE family [Anaerohalosphaera lusitana]
MDINVDWTGFVVGALFGASLILSGLANPDKIIGTLRLKDFHALRVIVVFILVGMLGVWILDLAGWANFNVKPAAMLGNGVGGALLGIGFGMTGYCPGTGLACAAAGRIDAIFTVIGMLVGAYFFILAYPAFLYLDSMWNFGEMTILEYTGVSRAILTLSIVAVGGVLLVVTAPRRKVEPEEARPAEVGEARRPLEEQHSRAVEMRGSEEKLKKEGEAEEDEAVPEQERGADDESEGDRG